MKKIYLLALFIGMASLSFSQTFVAEDFTSEEMPPAGWTIDGFAQQWSVSNTNNAGGNKPEGMFTYTQANSTTRLVSPVTDMTGYSSVTLKFSHFYDDYSGAGPKLGVATRSQGGEWNILWEIDPVSNVGPEDQMLTIDNEDMGQADFQFCFYLTGNFYNIDYWYVDNIKLFIPYNLDAEMTTITSPSYSFDPVPVKGIVTNVGLDEVNSFDVNWKVDNGNINTTSFTGLSLDMGDDFNFTCDQPFDFPIGVYELEVWLSNVNGTSDDNAENNSQVKVMNVASLITETKPLLEEFTSSTCAPCAQFNTSFVPWCENHAETITLVKYQMDWPGAGDPYYTEQGGERRAYYGVTWVPWLVGDGEFVETSISDVNSFYNNAIDRPSFAKTVSSHTINGTEISFSTTVLPFANMENYRVLLVVFENVTTENVASNGETEFHHVMMKMIPDAEGFPVDFVDREPVTFVGNMDLEGTNVEEWDDLGLAIIIQDYSSAYVQQSAYSVENGSFDTEAGISEITYNEIPVPDFNPEVFEYNIILAEGTTAVPAVSATAINANETVIVVPATELPGTTKVYSYAEDLSTFVVYTINFTIAVGVEEPKADKINLYPNPSNGQLTIAGAGNSTIEIFDLTGKKVAAFENMVSGKMDVSALENGMYLLNVRFADGSLAVKKFSVLK